MVSSSQRTALLEKYRYINVEYYTWWDCVEENFRQDMKEIGIQVDKLYFSGFCSQGDGACFVGSMSDGALKYLDHHHKDQFPMIRELIEAGGGVYAYCKHDGRYYHEYCTSFWTDSDRFVGILECPTEFQEQIAEQWDELLSKEMSDFEQAITDQWRVYMREAYASLEEEYDYLTSDDAVWDTIEANELVEDVDDDEDDEDDEDDYDAAA